MFGKKSWELLTAALVLSAIATAGLTLPPLITSKWSRGIFGKGYQERLQLFEAAAEGKVTAVRRMIGEGADLRATSSNGTTVLMVAAEQGRPQVVELLLAAGVPIDARDREGQTALMRTAGVDPRMMSSGHVAVVKQLLTAQANAMARDYRGQTAAALARTAGNRQLLDVLTHSQSTLAPPMRP